MKNYKKFTILILSVVIFFTVSIFGVKAAKVGGIAIEPVYSSNQIHKNGYLNPKVKPGSYQDFTINILSMSNIKQTVTIKPHTAYTSDGISIAYDKDKILNTNNLQYDFRSLFKEKSIKFDLLPGKAYKVKMVAKIPKNGFNGFIMGGFYITTTDNLQQGNDTGTMINNKYSYVMPAILKADNHKAVPELTLGNIEPSGSLVDSKVYNKKPSYINNMSIYSKITNSQNKTISEYYSKNNSVAPNTRFYISNLIYDGDIKPGTYHIKIVAKSTDPYKWVMEKDFTVSSSQYIGYIISNNPWIIYVIIAVLILIIILIIFILKKRKKKEGDIK